MVESSFHRIFQDYKYFGGLQETAGSVRCRMVSEILITNFVRHLLEFHRTLETCHVPGEKKKKRKKENSYGRLQNTIRNYYTKCLAQNLSKTKVLSLRMLLWQSALTHGETLS